MNSQPPQNGPPTVPAAVRVVHAVADFRNEDPIDLPPLAEVVNTDALDRLFFPISDRSPRSRREVTFSYADCQVTISDDGSVTIGPQKRAEE